MRALEILAVATCAAVLAACTHVSMPAGLVEDDGRVRVVATTGMIADVARNVGGDRVRVAGLMGPGVDPHQYRASEGDVLLLADADVVLYNGLHLEAKLGEVFERMGGAVTSVAVTHGMDPSELLTPSEFEGAHDPHVWFDVPKWMQATEVVRDTLTRADPAGAEVYDTNTRRYLAQLEVLHAYVQAQVEHVPPEQRVVITAHDAFNYFGDAYGFEVRGLQGISTATEAGTGDVQDLASFIVARRIPAVFIESSVPLRNIEAVQAAVQAKGFDVVVGGELFSDAMGDPGTDEGTYIGMVRHNVDVIVAALANG